MAKPKRSGLITLHFGDIDDEVKDFVEAELWNIGPYSNANLTRSAQQVFERALFEFGDKRCQHLEIQTH